MKSVFFEMISVRRLIEVVTDEELCSFFLIDYDSMSFFLALVFVLVLESNGDLPPLPREFLTYVDQ